METVADIWNTVWPFLIILTVIVFVHELGHYLIARWNKVRVEVFSIGFGPELFGLTDRKGTRWKFSALPLGGYVKFFGDANAASAPDEEPAELTPEERAVSFHHKKVGQRFMVVLGGPLGNFALAIVLFAILFGTIGQSYTPPEINRVVPGSPAAEAGLEPGDTILSIDGEAVDRYEDLQIAVEQNTGTPLRLIVGRDGREIDVLVTPALVEREQLGRTYQAGYIGAERTILAQIGSVMSDSAAEDGGLAVGDKIVSIDGQPITRFDELRTIVQQSAEKPLTFKVLRDGQELTLSITPRLVEQDDGSGNIVQIGQLGVTPLIETSLRKLDPASAVWAGITQTISTTGATLTAVGQMIAGSRSTDDLGGPIGIAQMSGRVAQEGFVAVIFFMAVLSINLGLINLFPVPVLDGGHLIFYVYEFIFGRPVKPKVQEIGFRIGFVLVIALMVWVTSKDLIRLGVVSFFKGLIS